MTFHARESDIVAPQQDNDDPSFRTIEDEEGIRGCKSLAIPAEPTKGQNLHRSGRTRLHVLGPDNPIVRVSSLDTLSDLAFDDGTGGGARDRSLLSISHRSAPNQHASKTPALPPTFKSRILGGWTSNKGLALVLLAQVFGTLMNVTTRLLEVEGNDGKGMHPFQILFARMGITVVLSSVYMWYKHIPDFPFGAKEVRLLLVARGLSGFFGVFGIYCERRTHLELFNPSNPFWQILFYTYRWPMRPSLPS